MNANLDGKLDFHKIFASKMSLVAYKQRYVTLDWRSFAFIRG